MSVWLVAFALALQQPVGDAALAARIPQLFHAIVTLDADDPQVKAAEAELRQLFTTRGVLTIAEVGEEASYEFVLLLCTAGPMNARVSSLSSSRAALSKGVIPADAVAFCTARVKQDQLKAQATRRPPSNPALTETILGLFARDQAVRQPQSFDPAKM